jgi:hypothetical protein
MARRVRDRPPERLGRDDGHDRDPVGDPARAPCEKEERDGRRDDVGRPDDRDGERVEARGNRERNQPDLERRIGDGIGLPVHDEEDEQERQHEGGMGPPTQGRIERDRPPPREHHGDAEVLSRVVPARPGQVDRREDGAGPAVEEGQPEERDDRRRRDHAEHEVGAPVVAPIVDPQQGRSVMRRAHERDQERRNRRRDRLEDRPPRESEDQAENREQGPTPEQQIGNGPVQPGLTRARVCDHLETTSLGRGGTRLIENTHIFVSLTSKKRGPAVARSSLGDSTFRAPGPCWRDGSREGINRLASSGRTAAASSRA